MSEISADGRREDRPACAQCGGTGYVYLWSVERALGDTWFCDRCKQAWVIANPLDAHAPAAAIGEPDVALPRRVGIVGEPLVAPARTPAGVGSESLSSVGQD